MILLMLGLMRKAYDLLGNIDQWYNALLCCKRFLLHFGDDIIQQCKGLNLQGGNNGCSWQVTLCNIEFHDHLKAFAMDHYLKKGEHMVFIFIKMIVLMFIYLMNLVLKRQSLNVYQARD
jgi:hypothetical protein